MDTLESLIVGNLFAFLLIFTRVGSAFMIMPGIGDSFVATEVRLLFALAISFVMTPILKINLPELPTGTFAFAALLISEALIGIFIGTVMRIMMTALDTAGMLISMQSGFSNAQMFNPVAGSQGSLVGAVYSMLGVTLLMVTDLHHTLIASVFESYQMMPTNRPFDFKSMSEVIATVVATSFRVGAQLAAPFLVIGLVTYALFGILGRLMPQIQVFFLALPVQILVSLIAISLVFSTSVLYWLSIVEDVTIGFLVK